MMDLFMEYYYIVFIAIIVIAGISLWTWELLKMDKAKRLKKIKRAAYLLVSEAEVSFGSRMGRQKFKYVHAMLSSKFKLFKLLPNDVAYGIIEEALEDLKEILKEDESIDEL